MITIQFTVCYVSAFDFVIDSWAHEHLATEENKSTTWTKEKKINDTSIAHTKLYMYTKISGADHL